MAQGSAKLATSCTVKGASASGVAGWSPEVSSAAVSAPSPDCAWLGWLPPEQAATTKAADRARVESRCLGRFALLGRRDAYFAAGAGQSRGEPGLRRRSRMNQNKDHSLARPPRTTPA